MTQNIRRNFETQLATLTDKFDKHRAEYLRPDFPETQIRNDLIDPFFEALGWDLRNEAQLGKREREVLLEQGETTGRPDYNFRLNGRTVFFVEAKAPHVPLDRVDVVMQTKTYAWHSRDVFIAAVTDFEEFRLYDATAKPDRKHPDTGLIFNYRYSDYLKPKTLDDLWLLSREAVADGSIDKLLKKSSVQARQRIPVDQAFLEDLSGWRDELAKAVFKANPDLSPADLNTVVQIFLDRLIFIRICEDRRLMEPRRLEDVARNWEFSGKRVSITNDLKALFNEVNDRLNGEIFKPSLVEKMDWDINAALVAEIIKKLYFPASPYLFDKIPVELLGSIYERYLGKTIRVTETRAIVEDKPEVRKAGGVYYTPKYIVDYIVEQTVGKLIEGKTPKQIEKLKILDPACGSGSFLIGAYRKLLDYHTQYYHEHARVRPGNAAQPRLLAADEGGEFQLSLEEKANILRNNIFGVDIDPQAVEITMMSLYIKMLEGEHGILSGRSLLPRLRDNIKCGNSLIGYDIANERADTVRAHGRAPLREDDLARINPFDWNSKTEGFGEIMDAGGFDAVIGNPPYDVLEKDRGKSSWPHEILGDYAKTKEEYGAALGGKLNLFRFFIVKSLSLSRESGRFGLIIPLALLADISCAKTRHYLMVTTTDLMVDCFPQKDNPNRRIFQEAKLSTMIVTAAKSKKTTEKSAVIHIKVYPWNSFDDIHKESEIRLEEMLLLDPENIPVPLVDEIAWKICKKIHTGSNMVRLGEIKDFDVTRGEINQTIYRKYITSNPRMSRLLKGVEIGQYETRQKLSQGQREWFDERKFLNENSARSIVSQPRIATQRITGVDERLRIVATLIDPPVYFADSTNSITLNASSSYQLKYALGLWNSHLFQWRFKITSTNNNVGTNELESMPFRAINFSDPADKSRHDKMVALVERMLDLHKQKQTAKSDAARERIEREIHVTDEQIDAQVYELYGLTKEEIATVEGK